MFVYLHYIIFIIWAIQKDVKSLTACRPYQQLHFPVTDLGGVKSSMLSILIVVYVNLN